MPLTILVTDDDPGIRLAISGYLEKAGYIVVCAQNGHEAMQLVEKFQPHLVVTDIAMPQMDGYELVRQIRQNPALRLLPVVFLTARTETQERVRGYQLGCDAYLAKPFELQELAAVVRNLLERQQMIESNWRFSRGDWEEQATHGPAFSLLSERPSNKAGFYRTASETLAIAALNLTRREQEVLQVLAEGLSNVQIGERLHLSPRTVEKYVSSLLRKTDTSNRAELVRFAMEHHMV